MTKQTFYRWLPRLLKRGWKAYVVYGCIRLRKKEDSKGAMEYCPITALYKEKTGETLPLIKVTGAAEYLGLDRKNMISIVNAADDMLPLISQEKKHVTKVTRDTLLRRLKLA